MGRPKTKAFQRPNHGVQCNDQHAKGETRDFMLLMLLRWFLARVEWPNGYERDDETVTGTFVLSGTADDGQ